MYKNRNYVVAILLGILCTIKQEMYYKKDLWKIKIFVF